jgi:DNA ligase 1
MREVASLEKFALVAEQVGSTTKKLQKVALLGEYFGDLSDEDLARAARFFAGQQFPSHDARTTNVGFSAIRDSLIEATGISIEEINPHYVRLGDEGNVAFEVMEAAGLNNPPILTLSALDSLFHSFSQTRGIKNRKTMLTEVLKRATPLEAKYLIKLLTGDLRIGLKEGLVEDAIARQFSRPLPLITHVNMLTGDLGETAVLARRDELHTARMRLFHPIKFMLATAAEDLSDVAGTMPEQFFVEDKFDGIRAQAHVEEGRVKIFTRTLDEVSHRFPELIVPLSSLKSSAIMDGEIVAIKDDEILPFSEIQKRLGRKTVSEELLKSVPVVFIAFDLIYMDGETLTDTALLERKEKLSKLLQPTGPVRVANTSLYTEVLTLDEEFDQARARGNEGLMIKDPRSLYKAGRRGREWLKLKRALATLDVVVTAVEVGHGKRHNLLSDYTFAVRRSEEDGELLNIGKAYSGLTDAELTEMTEWFKAHTIQEFAHGRVRVVEPLVVLEVTFDRIQKSNRHKGGYALRFPRILRIRTDKTPLEIDTLDTVAKLAAL